MDLQKGKLPVMDVEIVLGLLPDGQLSVKVCAK